MSLYSRFRWLRGRYDVTDDNFVFRLHYCFTFWFLLVLGFILGLIYYTTEKIMCLGAEKEVGEFCWSHGNLTLASPEPVERVYSNANVTTTPPPPIQDVKRYQLIFFKLIFHAIFFYLPRVLWKIWEGDKLKIISRDLDRNKQDDEDTAVSLVAEYLRKHTTAHNVRLIAFALCELLNFINVVVHLATLDDHLGNILSTHGVDVIGLTNVAEHARTDSMFSVFPRLAECKFKKIGASGAIQSHSTICMLPNNSLNEKTLAVVLVWLLVLAVISGIAVLYRIITLASSAVRLLILGARCRHLPRNRVSRAVQGAGDWFLLYQVSKNVRLVAFTELVNELGRNEDIDKSAVV